MIPSYQIRLVLRKCSRETYYEPCVVAHLPLISTNDRNISNKLDVNEHRWVIRREITFAPD